jgi:hypothetical protein
LILVTKIEVQMSLHSKLFRGDTKLEACLLQDSAHVTPGTAGNHVSKIQTALKILNRAQIPNTEIMNMRYGVATANAVLAYKQRRNIVNYSYQTRADNIVGKMTIASLDREMLVKEATAEPSCNYGPGNHSQSVFHPMLAFSLFPPLITGPVAPAPPVSPPSPPPPPPQLFAVLGSLRGARDLVQATLNTLESVAGGSMQPAADAALVTQALQTHYLCTAAELAATARSVRDKLNAIMGVLKRGSGIFVPGVPGDPDGENAYAYSRSVRDGNIYVNPAFMNLASFSRTFVLVHEAFHFLSEANQDMCRNPDNDGGKGYRLVPKNLRERNAYSLSQFVLHVRLKAEKTIDVETDAIAGLAP